MKKKMLFISIILIIAAGLSVLNAEPAAAEDRTLVLADSSEFEDKDTLMDYWFIASYNLMLQNKGRGGILAFDPDGMEYVAGYRMDGTPEDFFTDLPNSTLVSPMFMPSLVAKTIFASLGDIESISRLAYLEDREPVMLVSVLKLYDNEEITLEEAAFSIARQALEGSFAGSGLEIQDAYDAYQRAGVSQDDLVGLVLSGEKAPNEISLDAIRLMKAEAEAAEGPGPAQYLPMALAAMGVIGIILIVLSLVIIIRSRKLNRNK